MANYSNSFAGARKSYDEGLRSYMLGIYNYMAAALALTGIFAYATLSFEPLTSLLFEFSPTGVFMGPSGLGMLVNIAPLGIAMFFFMGFGSMALEKAKTLFWIYAAVMGMSLSSLGFLYTGESLARTFFICASVFGVTSIYGYSTKRDLTSIGSFMIMGLWGLIIASLVNLFLGSPAIYFATSILGVAIFVGLTAWDTQRLKAIYYSSGGGEFGQKMALVGAFSLYMDFINLFLYLLRFFGNRRD